MDLGPEAARPERRAVANEEARALGERRRLELLLCGIDGVVAVEQTVARGENAFPPGLQARRAVVQRLQRSRHALRHDCPRRCRLGSVASRGPDATRPRDPVEGVRHAFRFGRQLILPAAERSCCARELAPHVLDLGERDLRLENGGRPLEQWAEIAAERGDSLVDLLDCCLCRRDGPGGIQSAQQRVGPVGDLFGADPRNRRLVLGGRLRLGIAEPVRHEQQDE